MQAILEGGGFIVALQVNGLRRHDKGHLADIARTINGSPIGRATSSASSSGILAGLTIAPTLLQPLADALEQGSTAAIDGVRASPLLIGGSCRR